MLTDYSNNMFSGTILNILDSIGKTGRLFIRAALLLLLPAPLFAAGIQEETHLVQTMTASLQGMDTIIVSYMPDKVLVRTGDGEELLVKEYMSTDKARYHGTIDKDGRTLTVRTGERPSSPAFQSCIEILLPHSYTGTLKVSTTSGKIDYDYAGHPQVFMAKTTSGGIVFENLAATETDMQSKSGRIAGTILEGNLKVANDSGSVSVVREDLVEDTDLTAKSGKIQLTVPSNTVFSFSATSASGGIHVPYTGNVEEQEHSIVGTTGNTTRTSPAIRLRTGSGSITLKEKR